MTAWQLWQVHARRAACECMGCCLMAMCCSGVIDGLLRRCGARGGRGVGRGFCVCRYSGQGRAGQSGVQATVWVSDTSVVCTMRSGVDGSMAVALTAGGSAGSMTETLSHDGGAVSSLAGTNHGAAAGGGLSVTGADFGTIR